MARPRLPSLFFLLSLLLAFSLLPSPALSGIDSFIYGGCSQLKYTPASAYETNLNSLLTSLVNSASYSTYNNFTIVGSSSQDVVYGLYQCRGDLSMPDCSQCVASAVRQLGVLCMGSCGGALQLQGCFAKYDNTTFLGVEDKTVVLKKCGASIGYNSDTLSRRDAVLAGLSSGGGTYRVGGSGNVQGVAQCVGDLSPSECQGCLSQAIGRLRTDCGTAASGDMFLAKCYVRYSSSSVGIGDYYSKADNDSSDEVGKTLAIIIGLLAGVALIIVFASFLSRLCGDKGK
ncbi:PREDICTED: cysteine-rich repeat secretory protein 60-like [Nelumbo nucifera]|uniref:Gnk2-homologous domain-containing protein n=2 Tax=Nelumbo nucifera TaxID=4432 RepID=A0A822YLL5_NELNU|nr:PREDICTED: cysteine-rich repeat secretory protein 60-like [Nelumbo nucifera]DAD32179.1 TPA_asm: hypothetical protein HUJ06_011030 [Nelumbo nucifera]